MGQRRGGAPQALDADDHDDLIRLLAAIEEEEELARMVDRLTTPVRRRMLDGWSWQAHGGQREPAGDWRVWLLMAGRGFGKTRAGAEWVWARARDCPGARIALVGANLDDVAKVMVAAIGRAARTGESARWVASLRTVYFPTGAIGTAYSAEAPDKLRGPEHHFGWCDEIAKWARPDAAWDNLMLGLRLGDAPRATVTTTPRPVTLLARLKAMDGFVETGGRTADNPHLPADFVDRVRGLYAGTRLGRQELDGELIGEPEGALFPRALIESARAAPGWEARASHDRIVVGVDPPAGPLRQSSGQGDACGIVVTGLSGGIGYVLADESVAGLSPEGWAAAVARAAARWRASRVVAEANQGGRMVESVLRAVEPELPLKLVHASQGKARRAEPVAALFERGKAMFAGAFPALEDELAGLLLSGGYQGPGSPDRADAMVWALTELMLGSGGEPSVRVL